MPRKILKISESESKHEHQDQRFLFLCPGCGYGHAVSVPHWSWNGSFESPTFSPSVLTGEDPPEFSRRRCHSFVTEGKIKFLSDCHHSLAGKTVELPDLNENNEEKLWDAS